MLQRRPLKPSRVRIWMRRAGALGAAGGATALIALAVTGDEKPAPIADPPTAGRVPSAVRELVAGLSLEQKVDQVLALGFEGTDSSSPLLGELRERQLGAVFVAAANWPGAARGKSLIAEIRSAGSTRQRIPPLVIADQEGGPDRAFGDLPPNQRAVALGDFADPPRTRRWAEDAAKALARVGVDLNLGVIADVAPIYSPIADRAFSDDPGVAAEMVAATVAGCRAGGVACGLSHFPGLGAASADTDGGPATVSYDAETLLAHDIPPFEAGFNAGAAAVVLSHAFYAAYDPITPASQSEAIATDLLRRELGFSGLAITDDLDAGAVKALGSVPDAAVASLAAGADMVLIEAPGRAQDETREAILAAVRDGTISAGRIDEAAGRVIQLKRRLKLL